MIINSAMTPADILSQKDFAANLSVLKNSAKEWHRLTHKMIASACVHAHQFGDIRGISAVIAMMPAGAKTNSMRNYVLMFAPVKWSAVSKKFKFNAESQVKDIMAADSGHVDMLTEMLTKHWSSFGPTDKAESFKPFDLKAKLDRLLKDMNKALDADGAAERETIKPADVNELKAIREKLFGIEV